MAASSRGHSSAFFLSEATHPATKATVLLVGFLKGREPGPQRHGRTRQTTPRFEGVQVPAKLRRQMPAVGHFLCTATGAGRRPHHNSTCLGESANISLHQSTALHSRLALSTRYVVEKHKIHDTRSKGTCHGIQGGLGAFHTGTNTIRPEQYDISSQEHRTNKSRGYTAVT